MCRYSVGTGHYCPGGAGPGSAGRVVAGLAGGGAGVGHAPHQPLPQDDGPAGLLHLRHHPAAAGTPHLRWQGQGRSVNYNLILFNY